MKRNAGVQMVIKTGLYHQCAIREVRALRSFGPENILTCVGFHSVCLKLAQCRWCESERGSGGGGGVAMTREERKEGRECLGGWVQLSLGFTLCTSFRLILQVMDFPLLDCG